jgi:excisionase family DNA binding protein
MSAISMTEPIEKIYTLKEVADILRISVRTVYRMIKSGELDAFRVRDEYRVQKSTLEAFIARRGERE